MVDGDFLTGGRTGESLMVGDFLTPGRIGEEGRFREVLADGRGEGGKLREREARGERPILEVLVVRSMGERGEVKRERPTCPMGEQWMVRWYGDWGGRIALLRQSRGVTGERIGGRRGEMIGARRGETIGGLRGDSGTT